MSAWKFAAALVALGTPAIAMAQDDFPMVDWGPTMATEANNAAVEQAARESSGYQARRPRYKSNSAPPSTRSRRICADARDADDAGSRNPELPRLLRLCSRAGL